MSIWKLADLSTPWCLHVVATLRVAEHIQAGTQEIEPLARAVGANADSLGRVLRHLVEEGVFVEPTPGVFGLNALAEELLDSATQLGLDLEGIGGRMAWAWGTMLTAVRTGRPAYAEAFGMSFWQDLEAHPEVGRSFDRLMGPEGHSRPDPEVLSAQDWDGVRLVVDVGGGTGTLLAEVLRARPGVRGVLVDLPRTMGAAAETFAAAGVADRVELAGQSFFDALPAGGDLYLLKSIMCDWPDAEATAILRRCAEAARPAGRVVVFTNSGPGEPAAPELLMLVVTGGRERTVEDLERLGRGAGLEVRRVGRQRGGRVLVEMVPIPVKN